MKTAYWPILALFLVCCGAYLSAIPCRRQTQSSDVSQSYFSPASDKSIEKDQIEWLIKDRNIVLDKRKPSAERDNASESYNAISSQMKQGVLAANHLPRKI
jgi:hypothetical protein